MSDQQNFTFNFPKNWNDISKENPEGPPTFVNGEYKEPGILQLTYLKGGPPNPDFKQLISLSERVGINNFLGEIVERESGKCNFGQFGSVVVSNPHFSHLIVWHLSDGKDYVLATFICGNPPQRGEIDDAKAIILTLKKKSFWNRLFQSFLNK